jgi:hypothetical protein
LCRSSRFNCRSKSSSEKNSDPIITLAKEMLTIILQSVALAVLFFLSISLALAGRKPSQRLKNFREGCDRAERRDITMHEKAWKSW